MDVLLQAVIVFGAVMLGGRYKGIGLGIWGGPAVLVLALVCGLKPTSAPIDVILIILAVITAVSVMYAAGGLDYMVSIAEKIIRANPNRIVIVAPLVTWFFTFLGGTAHMVNSLLPVIYEVSMSVGIRPERSMTISTIASQTALVASPVAACTAALLGLFAANGAGNITLGHIMIVTVPATLISVVCGAFAMLRYGKDLKDDPEYQARLAAGLVPPVKPASARTNLPKSAQISMWLFILGVAFAVTGGFIPAVRTPLGMAKPMSMSVFLQLCMFATSLLILLVCKPKLNDAMNSPVMKAGITAGICVFGLAWMGDTFIKAHSAEWVKDLGVYVQQAPWLLAFAFFFGSSLLNSQAATVRALYPLGFALGLPAPMILGMFPACLGTSFFPISGVIVACINYDQSGTTRIGKYVLNHSFMLSVIVTTGISTVLGIVFAQLFL